jgi:outer membrane protein TolC
MKRSVWTRIPGVVAALMMTPAAAGVSMPSDAGPGSVPVRESSTLRPTPVAFTVEQAVTTALRESPLIRGAGEEGEAALGRLEAARAERRPWLSANVFGSSGNQMSIMATPPVAQPQMIMGLPRGGFVDANLMLMYPLYTGGRLQAMVRRAGAMQDASEAELETQRQEVALLTRVAYREILAREALVEVWQSRLEEDEERLRLDRVRLREGQIPAFYVLRGEAELAATRQELTNAERDRELALLKLRTVMGLPPDFRLELTDGLDYTPTPGVIAELTGTEPGPASGPAADGDLEGLVRLAERQRPELQAIGALTRASEAEAAAIRSEFRPQVNLFATGDAMNRDPYLGATVGAVASLPLYTGGQRRARLHVSEAEQRRRERQQEEIALEVGRQVAAVLLDLRAAEQNITTAEAALTAAREEHRVALLRYQAGRSIPVEVLDAISTRVRAESNVVQALFRYNVAQDQLRRALGEPGASRVDTRSGP